MQRFAQLSARRSWGIPVLLALSALVCFSTAPTHGDTIDLAYEYVEAGAVLDAYLGADHYYWDGQVGDGLLHLAASNPVGPMASHLESTLWAFCMELDQYTTFATETYTVAPLELVIGADKTSLIQQLYAANFDYASRTDTPVYHGGSQGGFVAGEPANNDENLNAIAMVYAVLEIRNDYDGTLGSLDLTAGQFRLGSNQSPLGPPSVLEAAEAMLAGLVDPQDYTGYAPELAALTNPTYQDMIVEHVPEPGTAMLLLFGAGLMLRGRIRRAPGR